MSDNYDFQHSRDDAASTPVRTVLQEAVLRAAVEVRKSYVSASDDWGTNCYSDALRCLHAAVDALLAAERAWGKGK